MKTFINKVRYDHSNGYAAVELMIPADNDELGSVVTIDVEIPINKAYESSYGVLMEVAIREACRRHAWLDKVLRPA